MRIIKQQEYINTPKKKGRFRFKRIWVSNEARILFYQERLMKLQTQKNRALRYRLEELNIRLMEFPKRMKKLYRSEKRNAVQKDAFYSDWRITVLVRDNFICQDCRDTEISITSLEAHHILSWKDNVNSRYDPDNGITLCIDCHRARHKKIHAEIQA